ncbi:molybdenum ABC transporter ATP-binding protein [Yunchengibacter salinarum]|uniref:molybdenum ABC transporter ATP-binding protein n=1 Tax=Yunchengibacter salinarum TaxID=3133399 RepID=UPI0035B5EFC4
MTGSAPPAISPTPSPKLDVAIDYHIAGQAGSARFTLDGGITALIGPSGSGKTSLARFLTGLLTPDRGHVLWGDTPLFHADTGIDLPPHLRAMPLVFQGAALMPHQRVRANLLASPAARPARLEKVAERLGIGHLLARWPHTLSGGEARRVAIGRALMADPRMLILDEATAGLDRPRRLETLSLIRAVNRRFGVPALMITHTAEDMLMLADQALVMDRLSVQASGPLGAVLEEPDTMARLGLSDAGTVLTGEITALEDGVAAVTSADLKLLINGDQLHGTAALGAQVRLRLRGRDVALARAPMPHSSILNQIPCRVIHTQTGSRHERLVHLAPEAGGQPRFHARITARSASALGLAPGDRITALIKAVAVAHTLTD